MNLQWRMARAGDYGAVRNFLQSDEDLWVSLIDRIESQSSLRNLAIYEDEGSVHACMYLDSLGLGIVACRKGGPFDPEGLHQVFSRKWDSLFCLMGQADAVAVLRRFLGRPTVAQTLYFLMTHERPANAPAGALESEPGRKIRRVDPDYKWNPDYSVNFVWKGMRIRRAFREDSASLLEIQCMYELEEVLVNGHSLNPELTQRQLDAAIVGACVYLARLDDMVLAKAATNGSSWHYAQIGGVFTLPAWRNRGIGEQLMKAVLQDIFGAGLGAALFVKKHNAPALHLYEKLGFEIRGELDITYY